VRNLFAITFFRFLLFLAPPLLESHPINDARTHARTHARAHLLPPLLPRTTPCFDRVHAAAEADVDAAVALAVDRLGLPENLPHALLPALARVRAEAPSARAAEATRLTDFGCEERSRTPVVLEGGPLLSTNFGGVLRRPEFFLIGFTTI